MCLLPAKPAGPGPAVSKLGPALPAARSARGGPGGAIYPFAVSHLQSPGEAFSRSLTLRLGGPNHGEMTRGPGRTAETSTGWDPHLLHTFLIFLCPLIQQIFIIQ